MNILIVYWHPEPQSINGEMFRVAESTLKARGHKVELSDLHEMNFDPVSGRRNFKTVQNPEYFKQQIEETYATENAGFSDDVENELKKIEWCDLMIWQFPLWWFGVPAVMKGWVDRVFAMGRAYGGGKIYERGVFTGKKALLSLTTGGPKEAYVAGGFNGDIMNILKPIHRGMLEFTGFSVLQPHIVYGPARASEEIRKGELNHYAQRLRDIEAEDKIVVGTY